MQFEAAIQYDENVIRRVTSMGYALYHRKTRQKNIIAAFALLVVGCLWHGMTKNTVALVAILIGCLIFTNINLVARLQAKRIIESMKGNYPLVSFEFFGDSFRAKFDEKSSRIAYSELQYIARDSAFFYLFLSENSVYAIDRLRFTRGTPVEFEAFLSEKTEQNWQPAMKTLWRILLYSPLRGNR